MYIYLNVYKRMTDVKQWLLFSNTWNHLIVQKNELWFFEKCYSTKCVNKSYIFNIYE